MATAFLHRHRMSFRSDLSLKRLLLFFPSLTDLVFVAPLLLLFIGGRGAHSLLSDGDTGWHIRTGAWILGHSRVPDRDLFSFSNPGKPWFAWEWLWDAIMGGLHRRWGLPAVVLANAVILCLTFAVVYRVARRRTTNDLIALAAMAPVILISGLHWLARPHLTTLLLFTLFYGVLERARDGRLRGLWLLPPLTAVWVNLHGGFVTGIALVGLYAAGIGLTAWAEEGVGKGLRRAKPFLIAAGACSAASLVNPYGVRLHAHIYEYLTDPFYRRNIAEFLPVDFRRGGIILFELLLLLGAFAAYEGLRKRQFLTPVLYLFWGYFALSSARNVPLFGIVCAPLLAEAAQNWMRWLSDRSEPIGAFERNAREFMILDRAPRLQIASVLAVVILGALLFAPAAPPAFRAEFDPKAFPAKALDALGATVSGRRIFSTDQWGGYIIYRLYPQAKVFIDGRSDYYGPEFVKKYLDVLEIHPNWSERLYEFGIDTVLMPGDSSLPAILSEDAHWRLVYRDDTAVVFERR